jgi:hypothetical protein
VAPEIFKMPTRNYFWAGLVIALCGVGAIGVGAAFISSATKVQSTGGSVVGLVMGSLILVISPFIIRMGYGFLTMRVVVTDSQLITHNLLQTRRCERSEITAIDLSEKKYPRESNPRRVPKVMLQDGSGFFLDALMGASVTSSVKPEQQTLLDDLREAVGVSGSETRSR